MNFEQIQVNAAEHTLQTHAHTHSQHPTRARAINQPHRHGTQSHPHTDPAASMVNKHAGAQTCNSQATIPYPSPHALPKVSFLYFKFNNIFPFLSLTLICSLASNYKRYNSMWFVTLKNTYLIFSLMKTVAKQKTYNDFSWDSEFLR